VLHHCSGEHRSGGEEEADCHTLDGGESETHLAESRVDTVVEDRDHDDNRDRIEVLDNIVRYPV